MYKKITLFFVFAVLLGMGSAWAQDPCTKNYTVCSGQDVVLSHDPSCGNGGHYTWAAFEDDCNYLLNGQDPNAMYSVSNCAIGAGWGKGQNPSITNPNVENYCHYPGTLIIDMKQGNNPGIWMPITNGADPTIYKYFIIRYKLNRLPSGTSNADRTMQIYFSNEANPSLHGDRSLSFVIPETSSWGSTESEKCSTTNFATIIIDASTNQYWTTGGKITGFRFDPMMYNAQNSEAYSVHMSIDYIALVATAPANPGHYAQGNSISFSGNNTFTLSNVTANQTLYSYQINNNYQAPYSGNGDGYVRYGWTSTESRHDVQVYPALNAGEIRGGSKQICYNAAGLPVTIANQTAASGGSGTISYQWYVTNGGTTTAITGATSEDYTIPNSYATNPGTYVFTRQAISSACESTPKTSEGDYTLTVLPQLSVNPSPLSPAITYGESVDINVVTSPYGIVSTSGLPNGVSYNTSTGHIVGTPTAAGTYNYSVSVTDAGGCGPATATGTIKVNQRTVTVSVADATKTYNGSEQSGNTELSFSGLLTGHTGTISYTPAKGTNASTTPYDNGSYGTNFKVMSGSTDVTANYNLTTKSKGKLTINQKSLTITAKAQEYTYNGSAQGENNQTYTSNISSKVTVSGLVGSDALTSITLNGRETNAGTYSSKIVPSAAAISGGAGNYNITYTAGQLKINPKAVTITAKPQTYTYTGQAQGENNATYTSNIASKVEVSGLVSGQSLTSIKLNGRETNAGTYNGKIVPSAAAVGGNTSNYSFTYNAGTLTIDKASIIIKANDASKVYGTDDPSSFTATVTGKPANGVNPVYTVTRPDAGTTAGENVGPHTLTVTANAASNPNYNITVQGGTFTITCKPVTVTAVNKEKYYNDPDPELTATVSGTLNNDPITYSVARADAGTTAGETVGDHTITVSGNTTQGNYCVTFVPGKLTIKARPNVTVTVTGHTSMVTYNGTLQSVSGYDFGTLPAGLSISDFTAPAQTSVKASGTNVKMENDGKYMMGLTPSDFTNNNPNFIVTFEVEDGWLKITPVTDVVTVNIVGAHDSKVHDGTAHSINGYTINSISNSLYTATDFTKPAQDAAVATANRTNVGTTMMALSAADFVNTNNNFSNVVFIVTPGYQTIKPANVLVCNGASVPAVNFVPETGMSYNWTVTGDAIGMSTTTGTGNIPSFTASNTGNAVKTATVTVAPKCTREGVKYPCESFSYTITVRPQVTVTAPVIQACAENQGESLTLSATVTNAQAGSNTLTWTFNAGEQKTSTTAAATQNVTATVTVPEVSATTDKPYYINYNDGICTAVCTSQVHVTKVTLAETTTAHTDVTCFGGSNGAFTVVAAGGTAGYSYTVDDWTTSNNDGVFSGLSVPAPGTPSTDPAHPDWETVTGDYTVKVKDANNCVAETTVTVFSPAKLRWVDVPLDTVVLCCDAGQTYATYVFDSPKLNTYANRNTDGIEYEGHSNVASNNQYKDTTKITFEAFNDCGEEVTCEFTITVCPNPTLAPATGANNPSVEVCHNQPMTDIVFNYANATITTEGSLPAGVTMTPAAPAAGTGTITFSGMPQNTGTTQATYSFKVKAASNQVDGEGATCTGNNVEQTVTITVNPVTDATISTTGGDVSQAVCVGQAITPVVFNSNGTLTAQGLPAGLTFSETTPRTLSGTPTEEGTYTVMASDQYECSTDSKQGTIMLKPVPTLDIDKLTQTKTYGQDMETVNVTYTNATVSLTNKPDWMTSTEGTGTLALSGTPTAAGTYEVTVTATSTQGCDPVEKTVKVVVDPLAVTVNITGNNDTKTYDAAEHEVTGYTATATSALYKVSGDTPDFGLKSVETASAKRTDVGTTDMGLTPAKFENHNSNFTVTFAIAADGYMKVTKRSLTLTSATDSREYNGNWLTNSTVNVTGEGWATGEGATYNVTGKQLLPGQSDNTFTYTLNSNTLASNYDINVVFGTLTVTDRTEPYQITVTSNSNTSPITYNGLEHNVNGFVTTTFTVEGNNYTVTGLSASVTDIFAGTYPNTITGAAVVKDEYGNDVTSQFDVSKVTGNLTIGKRPISFTIAAENASKVYDGTPLTVSYNQLIVNGLASTDQLIGGTITTNDFTVGLYPISEGNMFRMMVEKASVKSGFSIQHSSGELTKTLASYAPTFNITLSITSRPLTLIADDATKVYDGTPLTSNGFTLTSTLGTGDAVSATVNGSQTCVGESANVIDPATVQVMHDNGDGTFTDVTSSYGPVTLTDGVLKVTPVTSGFSCPAAITITLTEGKFDTIVPQSLLGNPSHDLMTVGRAQAANNLAALNPMDEGDHTVVWTLYDDCGNAMTSCEQVVTVVYAPCEPVLGYDGHDYDAVRIGYQCWLTENLRNTVDADGHPIADYHAYKENPDNMEKFGYLYSWYSAVGVPEGDDSAAPTTKVGADGQPYVQGICPEGWGVASSSDISILNYTAGDAAYLKDTDPQYWSAGTPGQEPNTGFKDRANGRYNSTLGRYEGIYSNSYFWASDATPNSSVAVGAEINYYCSSILTQGYLKIDRQGVRCVKKQ